MWTLGSFTIFKAQERSLDVYMYSRAGISEPTVLQAERTALFKAFISIKVRFPNHTVIELVRWLSIALWLKVQKDACQR